MPRNLKGGKGAKKKSNKDSLRRVKDDTPYPSEEENSHVAKVTAVCGDKRFKIIYISDTGLKNEEMISHLSRTASKRQGRIVQDSIVKISKRDFEDKCDILYQYDANEIQQLIRDKIIDEDKHNDKDDTVIFSNETQSELNIEEI
jgi:translation initiation factor IF-1